MRGERHIEIVACAGRPPDETPQLLGLGLGSLTVRTREILEPGQPVKLTIRFTDTVVDIDAEVAWANAERGVVAMWFVSVDERARERPSPSTWEERNYRGRTHDHVRSWS